MNIKHRQIEVLKSAAESGGLNAAQVEIIDRLIAATKMGTEDAVAEYLRSMDQAAAFWARNAQSFIQML